MFLDTHSLHLPAVSMSAMSDDEFDRLSTSASHCCPNCDGSLTIGEDEAAGLCSDCYYAGVH